MIPKPDPSGRWLKTAAISLVLMLASLYLGQGLPSWLYVVLVLGLVLLSFVSLIIHHLYDLVAVAQAIRHVAGKSRRNALIILVVGLVIGLKLLGIW